MLFAPAAVLALEPKHSGCDPVINASHDALPAHALKEAMALGQVVAFAIPLAPKKPAAMPVANTYLSCLIIFASTIN
jgi:hypothetical protein